MRAGRTVPVANAVTAWERNEIITNFQLSLRFVPIADEQSDNFDELLTRAKAGDEGAMAELVAQYEPEVRMVARVRLGAALRPHLDSVDLVQSVHKSLMLGLQRDQYDISSPEKLVALALTMVRRKVAKQWRKMKRQQRLESGTASGNVPALLASLCTPESDPAAVASQKNEIEQIFSKLSDSERQLIELRMDGYSTAEAARELGLDADVLRVHLSRLRKRLRAAGVMSDLL